MQVEVNLKCMQTKFGGCGFSGFGDFVPFLFAFKMAKISLPTMDYSPWGSKNRIGSKKFMQVEVDVKCMETKFGGRGFSGFGDFAPFSFAFKMAEISLGTMGYSPWGSKYRIG